MSTIAKFESNFKPETFHQEKFKDRFGNYIISRGLLQLSVESGRGYGCIIPQELDLHEPQVNLECGVKILNRWVGRDEVISDRITLENGKRRWLGGARYWAVLRLADRLEKIKNLNKNQTYCQIN